MKKLVTLLALLAMIISVSCKQTDFDEILRRQENQAVDLKGIKDRVAVLESLVKTVNTDIGTIKNLVEALEKGVNVVSYAELADKSGFELIMSDGTKIVLKHGEKGDKGDTGVKGDKGDTGVASIVSTEKDTDGIYYWKLDSKWLLNAEGNKIPVSGKDGQDGKTPIMRVNTLNQWEVSLNGGTIWQVVKDSDGNPVLATGAKGDKGDKGAPGVDGANGKDGVDGKDGADGAPGTDGIDGVDGAAGPQGPAGPTGPQGPAGPAGPQGPAGNLDLTITPSGDYIEITYNGATFKIPTGCPVMSEFKAVVNLDYKMTFSWKNPDFSKAPDGTNSIQIYVTHTSGTNVGVLENSLAEEQLTTTVSFSDGDHTIKARLNYYDADFNLICESNVVEITVNVKTHPIVGTWEQSQIRSSDEKPYPQSGWEPWSSWSPASGSVTFNRDFTFSASNGTSGTYTISDDLITFSKAIYHSEKHWQIMKLTEAEFVAKYLTPTTPIIRYEMKFGRQ